MPDELGLFLSFFVFQMSIVYSRGSCCEHLSSVFVVVLHMRYPVQEPENHVKL